MEDQVILVDSNDNEVGIEGKLAAHCGGLLHRAVSVFVFDSNGRLLLQKRASAKYHSGGLWSNTCCGHPRPGEHQTSAARRRLREEMGIDCELLQVFSFTYRAAFDNQLIENEYDHVFFGKYDGDPISNPEEVEGWAWMELDSLHQDMINNPAFYSAWFVACIEKVLTLRHVA